MKVMNVREKLKPKDIQNFLAIAGDVIFVDLEDNALTLTKEDFPELFTNVTVKQYLSSHHTLMIATNSIPEETCLLLSDDDYTYWTATTSRLSKLLATGNTSFAEPDVLKEPTIASGKWNGQRIIDIHTCTGTQKQLLNFINSELRQDIITTFNFERAKPSALLFNLVYNESDITDRQRWKTVDELMLKGKLK